MKNVMRSRPVPSFLWQCAIALSLTGGLIGVDAIAPPAVHAYVSRIDVTLDVQAGETYETLLRRAESVARAAVQRSFDRDILITEVYAIVAGQRQGSTVQVLSIQVSRSQWRSHPDARRWATYYHSAKILLGFEQTNPGSAPAASTPTVTSTPTVQQAPAALPTNPTPAAQPNPPSPASPPTNDGTVNPPARSPIRPIPDLEPGTTPLPPN